MTIFHIYCENSMRTAPLFRQKTILGQFGETLLKKGANLLTFSGLHVDPEIQSDGYVNFGMPAMRTVTLGLEVSF